MKILYRKTCEWEDVNFDITSNYIIDKNDHQIYEGNILAIEDDERKKYVKCVNCGELIRNTKAEIKKHYDRALNSNHCLTCRYMNYKSITEEKPKYTLNPDGTYSGIIKVSRKLMCNANYSREDINNEKARTNCIYARCSQKGIQNLNSFFLDYPDAFEHLATVDTLDNNMWTFSYYCGDECRYKINKRFFLEAAINNKGIIYEFCCQYRGYNHRCIYSKKYDKLFWIWGGRYQNKPDYSISESRINEVKTLISQLYCTKEN